MAFLYLLGDLHTEYSDMPSTPIGNTRILTTASSDYYPDGFFDIDFNEISKANTNFGIKTFYNTTYNPISDYNKTYKLEGISSKFISSGEIPQYSTNYASSQIITYRQVSTPPFYVGDAPIDIIMENDCPNNVLLYTALALSEPDIGTYYFTDIYKVHQEVMFTNRAASQGKFSPFYEAPRSLSFSVKELEIKETNKFTSRLNNLSFFAPANNSTNKTKFYLDYNIIVNKTLKSGDYPDEYNQRKSGFIGYYRAPIAVSFSDAANSVSNRYNIPHSIFQIATVNSNDSIEFKSVVNMKITTATYQEYNYDQYLIADQGGVFGRYRRSFYGNSPLFDDDFVTVQFSGCYFGYTLVENNITKKSVMSDIFSVKLGGGNFLGIENLCIGKGLNYQTDAFFSTNVLLLYGREQMTLGSTCHSEYDYSLHGPWISNSAKYNYLDFDYIINMAAKDISVGYPMPDFNTPPSIFEAYYNNYVTTYWSNNLI